MAYGYRQNKFVYSIANQEFYVSFYALDLANQEVNENGFVIIDYIYNFLYNIDKHFLFFTGPRWLWHKDSSSYFFVRSAKNFSLGQDIHVVDSEPWIFEGGFIWLFLVPIVFIKFYFISSGAKLFITPMRRELALLFNIIFENIKCTYILGTVFDLFFSADIANKFSLGSGVHRARLIYPNSSFVFLNHLNPFNSFIQYIVVYVLL